MSLLILFIIAVCLLVYAVKVSQRNKEESAKYQITETPTHDQVVIVSRCFCNFFGLFVILADGVDDVSGVCGWVVGWVVG